MNVEIGAEAALFPEKKHINGIFVAVQARQVRGCHERENLSKDRGLGVTREEVTRQ